MPSLLMHLLPDWYKAFVLYTDQFVLDKKKQAHFGGLGLDFFLIIIYIVIKRT